jgi:hypothetical protein
MTDTGATIGSVDAARAEDSPKLVTLAGREFILPPKMPAKVLVGVGRLQRGDFGGYEDAMRAALGESQWEVYIDLPGASIEDIQLIPEAYGMAEGEVQASGKPSSTTGMPSRPTSNGSTGSTWGQPSSMPSLP